MNRTSLVVTITAAVMMATVYVSGGRPAETAQDRRLPAIFGVFDETFWDGPWVFDEGGRNTGALPALRNTIGQRRNGPIPIRLDDGSQGTLRVESKPCTAVDNCEPFDCGCPLDYESYWVEATDSRAKTIGRMHLWAAYGRFDIVPVDLVDGPGDELVVVRIPAHASPQIGHDLKIWKLGPNAPVELVEPMKVAELFGTALIGCAAWRTHLFVNLKEPKPRTVALRNEFAALGPEYDTTVACRLVPRDTDRVRRMRWGQVLRVTNGKYRPQ